MPNENNDNPVTNTPVDTPANTPVDAPANVSVDGTIENVAERIRNADNILVTLSRDPSVDEMAAALGLTLMLDQMGKHATAIYSGKTPNALEFLEPNKTFETDTNSLQDFIIALNKDKADHLRYKIEDEFVKVYITPYRTTINESDLQFSHGDINVDLVISLNVKDVNDLDAALEKHGRIMHDASAVNISNDVPGKLGGIEWDNPRASSISEMIVKLIEKLDQDMPEEVATALLTGVVSATDRFSNDKTTPETMEVSAKLMESGANQQLVAVNMEKKETESVLEGMDGASGPASEPQDETVLNIARDNDNQGVTGNEGAQATMDNEETRGAENASPEQQLEQMISGASTSGQTLMDELKAATPEEAQIVTPEETSVATPEEAKVATPEEVLKSTIPEVASAPEIAPAPTPSAVTPEPVTAMETTAPVLNAPVAMPEAEVPGVAEPVANEPLFGEQQISPEGSEIDHQVVIPSAQGEAEASVASTDMPDSGVYQTPEDMTHMEDGTVEPLADDNTKDYGAMMEKELANSNMATFGTSPAAASNPTMGVDSAMMGGAMGGVNLANSSNPAIVAAPAVATAPEVQPVSEPIVSAVSVPPVEQTVAPETMAPNQMMAGQTAPEQVASGQMMSGGIELPQAPAPQVPGMEMSGVPAEATLPQVQPMVLQGDESAANGIPAAPEGVGMEAPKEELNPVIVQPEPIQETAKEPTPEVAQEPIRDPASVPPVADPGAFKIPGM